MSAPPPLQYVDARVINPKNLIVWEDDCHMCEGTMSKFQHMTTILEESDPDYGALKVRWRSSYLWCRAVVFRHVVLWICVPVWFRLYCRLCLSLLLCC